MRDGEDEGKDLEGGSRVSGHIQLKRAASCCTSAPLGPLSKTPLTRAQ